MNNSKQERSLFNPLLLVAIIMPVVWNYYGLSKNVSQMNMVANILYDLSKIIVVVIFYLVVVKNDFKNMSLKLFLLLFSTVNAISLIAMQMIMGIDERILIFPLLFVIVTIVSIKKYTSLKDWFLFISARCKSLAFFKLRFFSRFVFIKLYRDKLIKYFLT